MPEDDMSRFVPDFPSLLGGLSLEALQEEAGAVFGLLPDLTIGYLNAGWFRFAADNGGEPAISERFGLGTYIGSAIDGEARDFYLERFESALRSGEVWRHEYECSSDAVFRSFHQTAYPLAGQAGLVVVNSLLIERPHDVAERPPQPPLVDHYCNEHGLISQCSNCRRVHRRANPERWDWVPAWVARMPENITHTFCRTCFEYYFLRSAR
ncbi:hypothetical protein GMSM_18390 [Geomonas sp. Red276]